MATYIAQLSSVSEARIHELPSVSGPQKSIRLEWPNLGAVVVLFDDLVDINGIRVPRGLIVNVSVDAEDIEEAESRAKSAAGFSVALCCCTTRAAIDVPHMRWIYDATEDADERDLRLWVYTPILGLSTRGVDDKILIEWLNRLFSDFLSKATTSADQRERLWRAIASFRRGLNDNDDVLTEFLIHWTSLETLEIVYDEVLGVDPEMIYTTCQECGTTYKDCAECGIAEIHFRRYELTGTKRVFESLNALPAFGELSKLRNALTHGYKDLGECIETARSNLELVRTAVLFMLMEILTVDAGVRDALLRRTSIKGKFRGYVRFRARGKFTPGSVNDHEGHPGLEVTAERIQRIFTSDDGKKLHLRPTWTMTARNVERITILSRDVWGERGKEIEITPVEDAVDEQ